MNAAPLLTRRQFTARTVSGLGVILWSPWLIAAARTTASHRFLCCDYQGNRVAIVAEDGRVEWEFAVQTPQDCWPLTNGNVIVCHRHGVKEVARDGRVVWEYAAPAQ